MTFSISKLESLVAAKDHEAAANELHLMLRELDSHHGWLPMPEDAKDNIHSTELVERMTGAIERLFIDPDFNFTKEGFNRFIHFHRWLVMVFGTSRHKHSDHILRALCKIDGDTMRIEQRDFYKFMLLYSTDSEIPLQAEALWARDKSVAATLFFGLLSSRCVASDRGHEKRELLLEWLPARLSEIELEAIPMSYIHDVWMHCSYATTSKKHDIKRAINGMIRRWAERIKLATFERTDKPPVRGKPRLVVVVDWFHSNHVVYMCFSRMVRELRKHFHVTALCIGYPIDKTAHELFDESIEFSLGGDSPLEGQLGRIARVLYDRQPDMLFYLGVGMSVVGIFLSNLRFAPVQVVSHAHPSSTQSSQMDYFVMEEYYRGGASDFSEGKVFVPDDTFVSVPPSDVAFPVTLATKERIDIAVAATVMKLNPVLLRACARISEASGAQLHFLVGFVGGIAHEYVERQIKAYIPDAIVYAQQPKPDYLKVIGRCDLFIEPFPFGNANTTLDCLARGIPGVTMKGDQIFGHMGSKVLQKMGATPLLIARDVDTYVQYAVALAGNPEMRRGAMDHMRETMAPVRIGDLDLFKGRPERLGEVLLMLHVRGRPSPVSPAPEASTPQDGAPALPS